MHLCVYVCIYMYVCAYIYVCIYMPQCVHFLISQGHLHKWVKFPHLRVNICMCIRGYTHMYILCMYNICILYNICM